MYQGEQLLVIARVNEDPEIIIWLLESRAQVERRQGYCNTTIQGLGSPDLRRRWK